MDASPTMTTPTPPRRRGPGVTTMAKPSAGSKPRKRKAPPVAAVTNNDDDDFAYEGDGMSWSSTSSSSSSSRPTPPSAWPVARLPVASQPPPPPAPSHRRVWSSSSSSSRGSRGFGPGTGTAHEEPVFSGRHLQAVPGLMEPTRQPTRKRARKTLFTPPTPTPAPSSKETWDDDVDAIEEDNDVDMWDGNTHGASAPQATPRPAGYVPVRQQSRWAAHDEAVDQTFLQDFQSFLQQDA